MRLIIGFLDEKFYIFTTLHPLRLASGRRAGLRGGDWETGDGFDFWKEEYRHIGHHWMGFGVTLCGGGTFPSPKQFKIFF